jgi:hypothetical protein
MTDQRIEGDIVGWGGGKTKLMQACKNTNIEKVLKYIQDGADVNNQDDFGQTALHYACYATTADVVRILLAAGADPNIKDDNGNTPLQFICNRSGPRPFKIAQELIRAGTDIDNRNNEGQTALDINLSFAKNDKRIIELLRSVHSKTRNYILMHRVLDRTIGRTGQTRDLSSRLDEMLGFGRRHSTKKSRRTSRKKLNKSKRKSFRRSF